MSFPVGRSKEPVRVRAKTLPKTDNFGWLSGGVNSLVLCFWVRNRERCVFFETAIGFDSNDLSWFSRSVARDARGIRARSKKVRGIRVFLVHTVKKACDTLATPPTLAKGKYPYLFPCVFRFFLLSVSDPTHVFPRRMNQEPLPANPDGRRLVV